MTSHHYENWADQPHIAAKLYWLALGVTSGEMKSVVPTVATYTARAEQIIKGLEGVRWYHILDSERLWQMKSAADSTFAALDASGSQEINLTQNALAAIIGSFIAMSQFEQEYVDMMILVAVRDLMCNPARIDRIQKRKTAVISDVASMNRKSMVWMLGYSMYIYLRLLAEGRGQNGNIV